MRALSADAIGAITVLEPGGSDRTVAQDVVLATGQAALAMINGSMIDQSLKNDERWING